MTTSCALNDAESEASEPSPQELANLARAYAQAADKLNSFYRKSTPLSRAPFRLAAIHAIELYLNAYLQVKNHTPKEIRKLHHDLTERTKRATSAGLALKKRTIVHLSTMTSTREYLLTRYQPSAMASLPQINRLLATLHDVQSKVSAALEKT